MKRRLKFELAEGCEALETFVQKLPETFEHEGVTLYAQRNVVKRFVAADGTPLIVKRYKVPNFVQRFAYTFYRPSKTKRAFLYAGRLLAMGIRTPAPMAYLEVLKNGWFWQGYFVAAECTDPSLYDVLNNVENFDRTLATAFAAYLADLHQRGFLHGDLNLANTLYHKENETFIFTTIDINRSHFKENPTQAECLDNLKRITHRRDLLQYIVTAYANARGWDAQEAVKEVIVQLEAFERGREIKYRLKRKKNDEEA